MTTETAKFTLRIDTELLKKFRFVADYNARSANRELEVLMKKHIAEFEKENGKITFD
ncbi:Arc family DNA-binding protein [Lachnospiraceae bacterium 66-29]